MANATNELDSDELFHIAMTSSRDGRHEEAITALKRALKLSPRDARIQYMLGAEHAQIGLYDRAIEEMQQAVQLDPQLDTAYFQIGLIHITSGRVEQAEDSWKPLDKLGADHPLYLFKTGLLHLARDEFEECKKFLQRGTRANQSNQPLNADMERILKEVESRIAPSGTKPSKTEAPTKPSASKHVLLSAYRRNHAEDKED